MQKHQDAQTEAIRVTLIGMALDLALGVGKIIGGGFYLVIRACRRRCALFN